MQVQWKGMDLDKVVKKIKDHDEAKKAAVLKKRKSRSFELGELIPVVYRST